MSALGSYLRKNKIKKSDFAKRIGVTPGRVSQLLNGKDGKPKLELAKKIQDETDGAVTFQDWLPEGEAA